MDQAEWVLSKDDRDREYDEQRQVRLCAESMSRTMFTMEVTEMLEKEEKV